MCLLAEGDMIEGTSAVWMVMGVGGNGMLGRRKEGLNKEEKGERNREGGASAFR